MAQITATIFLIAVIAGIAKMVMDVQIAKVRHVVNEIKRLQVLAGIQPYDKEKGEKELAEKFNGVDINGIEVLADRFQKLAQIKDDK